MADNEKLDNQRLKNFKNKGRDLEESTSPLQKTTPGVRAIPVMLTVPSSGLCFTLDIADSR